MFWDGFESRKIVKTLISINVIKINRFDSLKSNLTASLVTKTKSSDSRIFLTRSRAEAYRENIVINDLNFKIKNYFSITVSNELMENQGNNRQISCFRGVHSLLSFTVHPQLDLYPYLASSIQQVKSLFGEYSA